MNWPGQKINGEGTANCKVGQVQPQLPALFLPKQGRTFFDKLPRILSQPEGLLSQVFTSFKTFIFACEKGDFVLGILGASH